MTVIASASIRCSCVGLRDQRALFGLDIGRSDHLSPHVDLDLDANVGAVLTAGAWAVQANLRTGQEP